MSDEREGDGPRRRVFLKTVGQVAMLGGLAASYGTCAAMSGRFLYPAHELPKAWQLVAEVARIPTARAYDYVAPSGEPVSVTRTQAGDYIALSSSCPHLGCQVHWQSREQHFFCPCHNGVFTAEGKAVSGPPAAAGQDLARYPLRVERGLLYIQVPMTAGASAGLQPTRPPSDDSQCRQGPDSSPEELS